MRLRELFELDDLDEEDEVAVVVDEEDTTGADAMSIHAFATSSVGDTALVFGMT